MSTNTMTFKEDCRTVREAKAKAKAWRAQEGVVSVSVERYRFVSGAKLLVVMPRCQGPLPDGCF